MTRIANVPFWSAAALCALTTTPTLADIEIISHSVRVEGRAQGGGGSSAFVLGTSIIFGTDQLINSEMIDFDTGVQNATDAAGNFRGTARGVSQVGAESEVNIALATIDGTLSAFTAFEATPDLGVGQGQARVRILVRFAVTEDTDYVIDASVSDPNGPITGIDGFSIRRTSAIGNPPVHLINSALTAPLVGVAGTFIAGEEYTIALEISKLTSGGSAQSPGEDEGSGDFLLTFESGTVITTRPPCLADVNNDGMLTPADFTAWINAFNFAEVECDQNGDGMCTPTDFTAWISNYNNGCP